MTVAELEELLSRRFGWHLESQGIQTLERAIRSRMGACGISSQALYLEELARAATRAGTTLEGSRCEGDELSALVEELLVPESWFFREDEPLRAVCDLLERHLQREPGRHLRVLSAPCSRGEEPLSIVMHLLQRGLDPDQFRVDAADLGIQALERARQGTYTKFSFRGQDLRYRDRFFEPQEGVGWRVKPELKKQVNYYRINLLETPELLGQYDVILCRNLLIYLSQTARMKLFHRLHRMLSEDGVLVVAACEFALPPQGLFRALPPRLLFAKVGGGFTVDTTPGKARLAPPRLPSLNPPPPKPVANSGERGSLRQPSAVRQEGALPPFDPLDLAEEYANQGLLAEAERFCQQALRREPNGRAYYLLALVCAARQKYEDAEGNLRRALYLDPGHKEALLQLALYRERAGDRETAQRLRERSKR